MTAPRPGDPSERLADLFREIAATRMAGLPILNPALEVEALGFRPWDQGWVGVLITPWFMSLVLLPDPETEPDWASRRLGSTQALTLPSGVYELLIAHDTTLGHYLTGSLFSPMGDFADMDQAREAAQAVLEELFAPAAAETEGRDKDAGGPSVGIAARLERPVSRRGFLGTLLGPGD